ncbi:MAG TPA: peptidoglycan editing factor PgeF [Rhodocyclaceae bacterium]|nr:peptidoglycan editing factor PgeF [Rhodocyclaceae bacterium]
MSLSRLFTPAPWSPPPGVALALTTRCGGVSAAPWHSFNLGDHVGDHAPHVAHNRALLRQELPAEPLWLRQVHGVRCIDAAQAQANDEADASFSRTPGIVCAVLTADCLPILLCDRAATVVAAIHAGWRGLASGVIESTLAAIGAPPSHLMAWFGAAISAAHFEVGDEVRAAFVAHDPAAAQAFASGREPGKWMADLPRLARRRLQALGINPSRIASADFCSVRDHELFYSYRRDGITGRMASLIWLNPP